VVNAREPMGGGDPDGRVQAGELDHVTAARWPANLVSPWRLPRAMSNQVRAHMHMARWPTDVRICRNEGVSYARIYAQPCIIFHD
jgi:hypothetical protein